MARSTKRTPFRPFVVSAKCGLNLREEPDGEILAVLRENTPLLLLSEPDVWVQVKAGDMRGWVMFEYLREEAV